MSGGARNGDDSMPLVAVYADESCLGNGKKGDNPGAAGALVEFRMPDGTMVRRDLWVSEASTTNNRMALRSAIETFRALSRKRVRMRVVFTSDSRYLIDGMSSWVHGWARKGWKRTGGPIENLELWQDAIRAVGPHLVEWRWVRGHAGHPQNEYANHLATRAAADQTRSDGLVESGYEEWVARQRARGGVRGTATPFPTSEEFRAGSALPRLPEAATAG